MRKLITGAIVAAALAVPATPAFAIHDPNVPAGNGSNPNEGQSCSAPNSKAVGGGTANNTSHQPDLSHSNAILALHNHAVAQCRNDRP